MLDLVVLDYNTGDVYFYKVNSDTNIEDFINTAGHNPNDCYYMIKQSINIIDYRDEKDSVM